MTQLLEDNQSGYILAIDQGTTSSRAIIVNHSGEIVGGSQKELPQQFPHPGWVEHDPNEIWNSVQSVIAGALIETSIHPSKILSLGITNQRETTIIWDKITGAPIYNAIVWQSRQTAEICQTLIEKGYLNLFQGKTGLIIDAYFSATKIRWILDQVPHAQERAEKGELLFGTVDTWLLWKLTDGEVHATDYTNASRTMLFNIHSLEWDKEILQILNIPSLMLPEVKENTAYYGKTKNYHFFGHEIPITGIAGDQQAALFGQLAFEPGMIKSTYGTGAFIMMNTGTEVPKSNNNLLATIGFVMEGQVNYALEGSIFVAGSAIQWIRDGLELIDHAKESEILAKSSKNNDEIYFVPAFTGLGAPYWDPNARGAILGLTRGTNKADIVKATLQSLAYQVRDIIDTMTIDTGLTIPVLKVDGGAAMNNYLLQFQADLLGIPLQRPKNTETTALGVAYMAGLSIGFWQDSDELLSLLDPEDNFQPTMTFEQRERLYEGWKKAIRATQTFSQ